MESTPGMYTLPRGIGRNLAASVSWLTPVKGSQVDVFNVFTCIYE